VGTIASGARRWTTRSQPVPQSIITRLPRWVTSVDFVYRPKVEHTTGTGVKDIQRFFLILSPFAKARYRLIVIGRKRLPAIGTSMSGTGASS
jgi:hypothetical protein